MAPRQRAMAVAAVAAVALAAGVASAARPATAAAGSSGSNLRVRSHAKRSWKVRVSSGGIYCAPHHCIHNHNTAAARVQEPALTETTQFGLRGVPTGPSLAATAAARLGGGGDAVGAAGIAAAANLAVEYMPNPKVIDVATCVGCGDV